MGIEPTHRRFRRRTGFEARGGHQAPGASALRLPGTPAAPGEPGYRCSLSGLAGFTGIRRAGPGSQKEFYPFSSKSK